MLVSPYQDIIAGLRSWQLWSSLSRIKFKQKYRRTSFGVFWATVSFLLTVVPLGYLYAYLFGHPVEEYLPYLATGFLAWIFISSIITEGTGAFTSNSGFIKEFSQPISLYAFVVIAKNAFIFAQSLLLVLALLLIYKQSIPLTALFLPVSLILLCILSFFFTIIFGILAARKRDVLQILPNIMRGLFFLTPILWTTDRRPGISWLVEYNPFYHLVELIRAPLLGALPTTSNIITSIILVVTTGIISLVILHKSYKRIVFWL